MQDRQSPSHAQLAAVFGKVGLLSFGGPAAQIAMMHRFLVDETGWLSERQYVSALSFCMLLPGPEAMQIATYAGWKLRGVIGGLIAGLLFILPGAVIVLALASLYAIFGTMAEVQSAFLGIKAAVLVIVIDALRKVALRALHSPSHYMIAGFGFVGLFFFALPFPLVLLIAALYGFFCLTRKELQSEAPVLAQGLAAKTGLTILIWLVIWAAPVCVIALIMGNGLYIEIARFFSKLAVVTFGGAYAVLAYMSQDVVSQSGWLTAGEMIDGLGLAETTPGPLILVTEFVGFLAAFKMGGFWSGALGAFITLWVTFVPCFLWIFAGAPYIDWISSQARLSNALSAITAAVVGVMLNLSLWFGLHTLFSEVSQVDYHLFLLWLPELSRFEWRVAVLAMASAVLILRLRWGMLRVLGLSGICGFGLGLI